MDFAGRSWSNSITVYKYSIIYKQSQILASTRAAQKVTGNDHANFRSSRRQAVENALGMQYQGSSKYYT